MKRKRQPSLNSLARHVREHGRQKKELFSGASLGERLSASKGELAFYALGAAGMGLIWWLWKHPRREAQP